MKPVVEILVLQQFPNKAVIVRKSQDGKLTEIMDKYGNWKPLREAEEYGEECIITAYPNTIMTRN